MSGSPVRILVVEDNPITRKMIRVALAADGYEVMEAADGKTAVRLVQNQRPDLVLQDLLLPDGSGVALVSRLRALPGAGELPIIALTGFLPREEEARALTAGFTEYLIKPVEPSRLLETVRSYLGPASGDEPPSGGQTGKRILAVDDDPLQLELTKLHLERQGYVVETASDGAAALEAARRAPPDAILSDVLMPRLDGFKLCQAVRSDPALRHLPVVLHSNHYAEAADRDLARRLGANAYVARTPSMHAAASALQAALAAPAPPVVAAGPEADLSSYQDRVVRLLERQAAQNAELLQRSTVQAAALAVLGSTADALAHREPASDVLQDTLYRCIDAAGVSVGAFYERNPAGGFVVRAVAGYGSQPGGALQTCFGHPELIERTLVSGTPLALPSADARDAFAQEFLSLIGLGACLLVPVSHRAEPLGVLLLASNAAQLATPEGVGFAQAMAGQIGQALALQRSFEALRSSRQLLKTIVDSALDAVITMDDSGRITSWNGQAEAMFQWTAAEAMGRKLADTVIPPAQRAAHERGLARFLATGHGRIVNRRIEVIAARRDGLEFPVELTVVPSRQGERWMFAASVRDITERRRAEESLRESEQRHRALVDYTFDGFVITENGVVREANRGFAQMFGYTVDEVIGKSASDFVAPESVAVVTRRIQAGEEGAFNVVGVRADGQRIQLETVARMYKHGDRPLRLTALRDVTDRRQLEDQFRQSQKMEAVGRLAGGVAHDFNNLLTVITSYSQLLLDDLGAGDPRRADLEEIRKAAAGAATLTRQLLAFSRQQVLEPKVLDLNGVVAGAGKMLKRLIGEDIELVTDLAADLGTVKADPGQLEQVVMNLAVNARDAMPMGGKLVVATRNIEVADSDPRLHGLVPAGPYAQLAVRDSGVGMDEQTKARIFEPFFTTKETGKGTGLGLATVYGIIKQSEGFIAVDSEAGRGTTFTIYLPRVNLRADPEAGSPAPPASLHGMETVLVAEDAGGVRTVARQVLKRHGYVVLTAADGETALELAAEQAGAIHLLVTDVIMPEMSGRQLADRLREARPDLKVLYVSGYTDDAIVRHGILEPGIAFLQKPFTPEALARKVREVLDRAR